MFEQCGDGTYINRATPVNVSGLSSGVLSVSSGGVRFVVGFVFHVNVNVMCWHESLRA